MNYKTSLVLVLIGLLALFILQNIAMVEIRLLFWSIQMPRSILMFLMLAIGVVIGWFLRGHFSHREENTLQN